MPPRAVNAIGAGNVAAAAAAAGAWIVHVSTDYVFDGTKTTPYLESDPTGPRSVYGATKLLGEHAVALPAPRWRTRSCAASWLFGTGGPCFPATMLRLAAERDTLTVVDDQVGCPTFTGHLAPALVDAGRDRERRIARRRCTSPAAGECSWFEFAREIVARGRRRRRRCDPAPPPSSRARRRGPPTACCARERPARRCCRTGATASTSTWRRGCAA